MLVAVNQECLSRPLDIGSQAVKAAIRLVLAVVDSRRRIVGEEYDDLGKSREQILDLALFEQELPPRLVFPRPAEAAEPYAAVLDDAKMQVCDGRTKRLRGIVIAPNSEDHLAGMRFRRL